MRTAVSCSRVNLQNIQVSVHLSQDADYIPGEVINDVIETDNPKHIRIKQIQCNIEEIVQAGDDSYTVNVLKVNLPKIIDINEAIRTETIQIQIPQHLSPSYDNTADDGSKKTAIVVEYA